MFGEECLAAVLVWFGCWEVWSLWKFAARFRFHSSRRKSPTTKWFVLRSSRGSKSTNSKCTSLPFGSSWCSTTSFETWLLLRLRVAGCRQSCADTKSLPPWSFQTYWCLSPFCRPAPSCWSCPVHVVWSTQSITLLVLGPRRLDFEPKRGTLVFIESSSSLGVSSPSSAQDIPSRGWRCRRSHS